MSQKWCGIAVLLFILCACADTVQAEPQVVKVSEQAPGNRLLFRQYTRTTVLPPGSQDKIAVGTLAIFIAAGLTQLRSRHAVVGAAYLFFGTLLIYGAWVLHKYTISGGISILFGHLACLLIAARGVTIGMQGVNALLAEDVGFAKFGNLYLPAIVLVLGVATGTATIFEAAPTIYGINPPLAKLALMIALGSGATASAILIYIRKMRRRA